MRTLSGPQVFPKASKAIFRSFLLTNLVLLPMTFGQGSDPSGGGEDVFHLDPFEVAADAVDGYSATTAMTATKIGALIKETPLNVQVLTSEFIEDTGMQEFAEITRYSTSFSADALNASNFNSKLNEGQGREKLQFVLLFEGQRPLYNDNGVRLRAFRISNILRNGLPRSGNHSLKGVDRVEIVKGPVAIFFGQSQPGGAINYVTKRPTDELSFKVSGQMGAYDLRRWDLDANIPVLENFGIRVMASDSESDGWRQFESSHEEYFGLVSKLELFKRVTLVVEAEHINRIATPAGAPIVTNPQYHDDYFNPPEEILFLSQDSSYGRNPWNRGFGREDTIRRWQGSMRESRDVWMRARAAAFPEEGFPLTVSQFGFDGSAYYEANIDSFENAVAPVYGPDANLAGPSAYTASESDVAYYELSVRPLSWLDFKFSGNYGESERPFRVVTVTRPFADFTIKATNVNAGKIADKFTNHIADFVFSFDFANTQHKFITGGELRRNEETNWGVTRSWPADLSSIYRYWDPRENTYPPLSEVYPIKPNESDGPLLFDIKQNLWKTRIERYGAYLMHQGTFLNGRLHTMAGIRHENQTNESFAQNVSSLGWIEDGVASGTSKALGFVYELNDSFNVYASWNQNFNPNAQPRVVAGDAGDLNAEDLAEFGFLDDETGTGIDLGLKFEAFDRKLTGQISLFEIEREGIARIDWERSNQRMLDEGWTDLWFRVEYYVNGGLERARGVEIEILANPTRNWQVLFGYTHYFEADVINDPGLSPTQAERVVGQGLPNVSKHRLSIWNNYEFDEGSLEGISIGGGLRYASEHNPLIYDWQNSLQHDSYLVFDARLGYEFEAFKGELDVTLTVNNLTDEFYSEGGLGFSPPRTWIAGISYKF
jgi:outer membrane receptor protein involved in Fe transport